MIVHFIYVYNVYNSGEHLANHSINKKHYLYFELSTQQIYCILCGDYHTSSECKTE